MAGICDRSYVCVPARLPVHLSADGRCIRSGWAMEPRTVVDEGGEGGREREFTRQRERERERDERTMAGRHEGKQEYLQALDRGAMAAQRPSDYRYYTGVKQRTAPP